MILNDEDLRQSCVDNALRTVKDNHNINSNANKFKSLIVDAVNLNETNITGLGSAKADKIYVNAQDLNLAGVGRTVETIKANFDAMITHKGSSDHDGKYYTKILH